MIQITNGVNVLLVTNGAYENLYKPRGYRPYKVVAEAKKISDDAEETLKEHGIDVTELLTSLVDKPVRQWSKEECMAFVEAEGIGLGGATKSADIKAIIQSYIDEK